ncbi:MAG: PAS domain-containing protein [Geobacteraceae bacterium]|nr:PAS domain-containing protein [Geobacteraceae bacterium]
MDYMTPDDAAVAKSSLERAMNGEVFVFEEEFGGDDRDRTWFEISQNQIMADDGSISGVAVFAIETTERRRLINALQETNELFDLFLLHSPIYAFIKEVTATESRVLRFSRNYETWIGLPSSELIGRSMADLFPAELARRIHEEDRGVVSSGEVLHIEEEVGGRLYNPINFPIIKEDASLVAGYTIDITESRQAEKELKKKNAEIEQFIYTVSHDLRSPLVTVKTFLGYLECDLTTGDQERITQDLQFMHGATDKMKMLLDELLELSRVDRTETAPSRVSLREILDGVLGDLAGVISERGVAIHLPDRDLMLYGDRLRLSQIWQNLIENAIKYSLDGTPPLIELGLQQENGETVFYVRDTGIGIDPQYHHKVFGIFEKLDPKSSGVGLGLPMIQRIVEKYGGTIWVESAGTGRGSCFRFTLPRAAIERTEELS